MRKKMLSAVLGITCLFFFAQKSALSQDLKDVISSLYGGNGIQLGVNPAFNHSAHFAADSLKHMQELAEGLSQVSFPLPSTQGGYHLTFNNVTNEYESAQGSLGPIFGERAGTLGKGGWNFGVSYTYVKYTQFEGDDLKDLSVTLTHTNPQIVSFVPGVGGNYYFRRDKVLMTFDVDLKSQVFALYGSHGITDKLDVSFLIPLIRNELSVDSRLAVLLDSSAQFVSTPVHLFDATGRTGDPQTDSADGSASGIGDLILSSKYAAYQGERFNGAGVVQLRLPTGDEDNFLGKGKTGGKVMGVISSSFPMGSGEFNPHLNVGYDANSGSKGQDSVDYTLGFDYGHLVSEKMFTAAAGVVGSREVSGTGDDAKQSLLDLDLGFKIQVSSKSLVYFNVQVPLNDDGLRADQIFVLGYEQSL